MHPRRHQGPEAPFLSDASARQLHNGLHGELATVPIRSGLEPDNPADAFLSGRSDLMEWSVAVGVEQHPRARHCRLQAGELGQRAPSWLAIDDRSN
jgi:hypothetical protein